MLNFENNGFEKHAKSLTAHELSVLEQLFNDHINDAPGVRIVHNTLLSELISNGNTIDSAVTTRSNQNARAVRAVLFDKTPQSNWSVGWHQDRTIAVVEKVDVDGFGPWTIKSGITHVEPPFEYIERMITLRIHLDPCGPDNAPLKVSPGSHRLGRISENRIDKNC